MRECKRRDGESLRKGVTGQVGGDAGRCMLYKDAVTASAFLSPLPLGSLVELDIRNIISPDCRGVPRICTAGAVVELGCR